MSGARKLLSLLALSAGALVAAELAARAASLVLADPAPGEDWYAYSRELGWVVRPGHAGPVYGVRREHDARGFARIDAADLAGDGPRVLFLGDSITYGFRLPAEATFVEAVDRALPGVAAINLGVPGYTSYQGRALLERALELRPAAVVLAFGANDRRYVLRELDADGLERFEQEYANAFGSRLALRSALYRWTWRALPRGAADPPRRSGERELRELYAAGVRADRLLPRVSPERFRENLAACVRLARSARARPIVLALPDHPRQIAAFDEAREAERAGDAAAAEALLAGVAERDGMYSVLARRALADLLRRAGRADEAERRLLVPKPIHSLHGGAFVHFASEYRDVAREVAREEGADFVDASEVLGELPEAFLDYCHLTELGNERVADLLLDRPASGWRGSREDGRSR